MPVQIQSLIVKTNLITSESSIRQKSDTHKDINNSNKSISLNKTNSELNGVSLDEIIEICLDEVKSYLKQQQES